MQHTQNEKKKKKKKKKKKNLNCKNEVVTNDIPERLVKDSSETLRYRDNVLIYGKICTFSLIYHRYLNQQIIIHYRNQIRIYPLKIEKSLPRLVVVENRSE